MVKWLGVLCCLLSMIGCGNSSESKPSAHIPIDIPDYNYKEYLFSEFKLQYSDLATIHVSETSRKDSVIWFDISYPSYNAVLHCTYLPLKKNNLDKTLEDNHRLVYSHVSMASGINQVQYTNKENKVSGIVYEILGDVATPLQFYVMDSTSNFIRGSLYYESVTNSPIGKIDIDSVAPITNMIKKDISYLIETLHWTSTR